MPKAISKEPKNVRTACDPCRSSKTKCDGQGPCFQCKSRNFDCLYTKVDGRTRTAAKEAKECLKRKIEKLKAVVKRLRLRLAVLPGGTNSAGASVNDSTSDVDSTSKVDIGALCAGSQGSSAIVRDSTTILGPSPVVDQAARPTLYGTGLHSPRTRPSSPNWTRDTHARSLSDSHAVHSDGLHLTIPLHHPWRQPTSPLTPESGPSPVSSHASLGDSSPSSENHATAHWIQAQSMGTARRGSAQDDVALALSLGALDVRARTPSAQSGSPYSAHSPRSPVPYTPRATDRSPYLPFPLHALSEQDHDTILTTYLHTAGPWKSHVVPELFLEDLRAVRAGNTPTRLFFSPALHCACLLSALVSSDPNNPGRSPSTLNELFRTAKELAHIECAADEQIAPAVIALVILAGYSMQFPNGSRLAYLLLGYASRAADILHLDIPVASDSRATWGRAWSYWELFRMDTIVALHVQSTSRLARPRTPFHVVQQGIQQEIAKLQLSTTVDKVHLLVHYEICRMVSDVADPPPSFDGFTPPAAPLYSLRDVLNLRRASFPLEVQLASYNEVSPPPAVVYLHGQLDCVVLLSHRGPDTTCHDEGVYETCLSLLSAARSLTSQLPAQSAIQTLSPELAYAIHAVGNIAIASLASPSFLGSETQHLLLSQVHDQLQILGKLWPSAVELSADLLSKYGTREASKVPPSDIFPDYDLDHMIPELVIEPPPSTYSSGWSSNVATNVNAHTPHAANNQSSALDLMHGPSYFAAGALFSLQPV